jgi:hypothetical protein
MGDMAEYTVLPFDPNNIGWLQAEHVAVPQVDAPSRYPTINELKQVLSRLAHFRVQFAQPNPEGTWDVVIDRPDQPGDGLKTILRLTPYQGDDMPHGFWFESGWPPLVIGLLKSLAESTGPLGVLATANGAPAMVEATSDVQAVLHSWRHTRQRYG